MLDTIEKQFQLSGEKLQAITRRFIEDFNVGLSKYNEAMAMMFVYCDFYTRLLVYSHFFPVPLSSLIHYRTVLRKGMLGSELNNLAPIDVRCLQGIPCRRPWWNESVSGICVEVAI